MSQNTVPIVFATNKEFADYCYVAIHSVLAHAKTDDHYTIRVLMTDFSDEWKVLFESLSRANADVTCINVSDRIRESDLRGIKYLSAEALYRLFIPKMMSGHDRVLYLDSDLVVKKDVAPLLTTDLQGCPIAVVSENHSDYLNDHATEIGMRNASLMFNTGVMVMDTRVFEQENIRDKALALLYEDYRNKHRKYVLLDQDILNVVLEGNICYLDGRWNFQPQYMNRIFAIEEGYRKQYQKISQDPWIVHFAGINKPWNVTGMPYADVFWDAVRKTERGMDIALAALSRGEKNLESCGRFQMFRFPYESVRPSSRIALYGAGTVGQDFYHQLQQTLYAQIVLWVDRRNEEMTVDYPITAVPELYDRDEDYDCVVIALEHRETAMAVRERLIREGINQEKLVWANYLREAFSFST